MYIGACNLVKPETPPGGAGVSARWNRTKRSPVGITKGCAVIVP